MDSKPIENCIKQLNLNVENGKLNNPKKDEWSVVGKKKNNRSFNSSNIALNPAPQASVQPRKVPRPPLNNVVTGGGGQSLGHNRVRPVNNPEPHKDQFYSLPDDENGHKQVNNISDDDDDDDYLSDDSDEELDDSMYDSDASEINLRTGKNNKWFQHFFKTIDELSADQLNDPFRRWHCPACQNGPGAINWYSGLPSLIIHAKTMVARRAKLHRKLGKLLEEDLKIKGPSLGVAGETYGKWKGLRELVKDHEIVWPPMVVVMNTQLKRDANDKWTGMGNQELLDYFSSYKAVRARHAYGPQGHRGMSLLIFEASAMGFIEAERLDRHFSEQGTNRNAWGRNPTLFYPGGKRQLYGYLAIEGDLKLFNQHSKGKWMVKYEVKSYEEMVVDQMKQMSENNKQLKSLKHKVDKKERESKVYEETFGIVSQKLRQTVEENSILMLRTKMQREETKEEMDFQENFFKEKIEQIQKDIEEKEQKYEILLQEECAKAHESAVNSCSNEERMFREKEIQKFIDSQVKGVAEFEAERNKLIRAHVNKTAELKRRYLEDKVKLEKEFNASLTKLMEKYTPSSFETSSISSGFERF